MQIIDNLIENNQFAEALIKAQKLLNIGHKDISQIAEINKKIGEIYFKTQKYAESKPYFVKAIELFQKQNNCDVVVKTESMLAIVYAKLTEFDESKKLFEKLALYNKSHNNDLEVVKALGNIATVHSLMNNFEFAIKTYKNCKEFIEKSDDQDALAMVLYNLGENYMYMNDFENAITFLNEGIDVCKKSGNKNIQARAYDCLAGVAFQQNKLEVALENEEAAGDLISGTYDNNLFCNIQLNKAKILMSMNNPEKSLEIIESVFAAAKETNNLNKLLKYYGLKCKIYESVKNYKDAYNSSIEINKITEQLYNVEKLKTIEESQKQTSILMDELKHEQKEKELIILRTKKELQDKELTFKTLQLIQKNELIINAIESLEKFKSLNPHNLAIIKEVTKALNLDRASKNIWDEFGAWFKEVNRDFFTNLESLSPNLTKRYLQLASLIKLDLRSKDIAPIMGITFESVEKYRTRLRKKLGLKHKENLTSFIKNI